MKKDAVFNITLFSMGVYPFEKRSRSMKAMISGG